MKWFQHDSDASQDAKVRRLIIKHGPEGYAVYFHCLELIASNIETDNITFELEHDANIIADNLKIKGEKDISAVDKVNNIMLTILDLGLFTSDNNRIFCFKMMYRLDNTISRNPQINTIKNKIRKQYGNTTKLLQSNNKPDNITLNNITLKDNKINNKRTTHPDDKLLFQEVVRLTQIEYDKLLEKFGKAKVEDFITRLNDYIQSKGKRYPSHYHTILNWERRDNGTIKTDKKGQVKNDDEWEYDKMPEGSMVTGKEKK